jgi:hypothetical protein
MDDATSGDQIQQDEPTDDAMAVAAQRNSQDEMAHDRP